MKALPSASRHPVTTQAALLRARRLLCRRIDRTSTMSDSWIARDFARLVAAVEADFRQEESAADLCAPSHLHAQLADHALILAALHRTAPAVAAGDAALGRAVLRALRDLLDTRRAGFPGPASGGRPMAS